MSKGLISAILKLDKNSSAHENLHYTMAFLNSLSNVSFSQGLANLLHLKSYLKSYSMASTILIYHSVSYFHFTNSPSSEAQELNTSSGIQHQYFYLLIIKPRAFGYSSNYRAIPNAIIYRIRKITANGYKTILTTCG